MKSWKSLAAGAIAALTLSAVAGAAHAGATMDAVKARGVLRCGVNTALTGFSAPDAQGHWSGIDVDVCRAVATALFNDPNKVQFVPLSAQQRFTALQSGEIDMLSRNTTWTLSRDTQLGITFAPVVYYDGQGFLVSKKLGLKSAKQLKGATVCVQPGTTTELNLADFSRTNHLDIKAVDIEKLQEAVAAFFSGRCDAFTSDASQLASVRAANAKNPGDYVILPERISKEPLAPAVRQGDVEWFNLVKWSVYALIDAEELGVNSKNVDEELKSTNPKVQRLLGVTGDMGKGLGVDNKWAYDIVKKVGNYGEIFDRNVGAHSELKLDRGLNALWTKGGLMYGMPIR